MHTILQGVGYFIGLATILPIVANIHKVNLDNLVIYVVGALGGMVLSSIFIVLGASSKAKSEAKVEADRLYIESGGETKSAANQRRVNELEQETLDKIQDKTQKFENESAEEKRDKRAEKLIKAALKRK